MKKKIIFWIIGIYIIVCLIINMSLHLIDKKIEKEIDRCDYRISYMNYDGSQFISYNFYFNEKQMKISHSDCRLRSLVVTKKDIIINLLTLGAFEEVKDFKCSEKISKTIDLTEEQCLKIKDIIENKEIIKDTTSKDTGLNSLIDQAKQFMYGDYGDENKIKQICKILNIDKYDY